MKSSDLSSKFLTDPATTACFSGHRPEKLPFDMSDRDNQEAYLSLTLSLIDKAYKAGYRTFITGMARGFDILAAFAVIRYKNSSPEKRDIVLVGASPYRTEIRRLKGRSLDNYLTIREACDDVIYINEDYHGFCFHERNCFMVDHSSLVISSCLQESGGTASTLRYAKRRGLRIDNIGISELKEVISFNDTSDEEKMQQQFSLFD